MPTIKRKEDTRFNLTKATDVGRKAVKFGAVAIVALMVGRVFITSLIAYWKATHPEPPPPPTVGFGRIPAIEFPTQSETDKPKSFRLETATGGTPDFGDRAKVFLVTKSVPNLLNDKKAREIAASYEFRSEPEIIKKEYRWTKSKNLELSLLMNIDDFTFSVSSDYLARPELLIKKKLPENFEAVNKVKAFLTKGDLLPADVASSAGRVSYLKSLGGELAPAFSLSDSDFLRVDLDRYPVDGEFEMYGPKGTIGAISAILGGEVSVVSDNIVQLDFNYYPIDYSQVETYPIRTSRSAWKVLQAGEGYIAQKGDKDDIVIRDITLGYYEAWEEQPYLQPVFVFKGDGGFIGYVPAVDPSYLLQPGQTY